MQQNHLLWLKQPKTSNAKLLWYWIVVNSYAQAGFATKKRYLHVISVMTVKNCIINQFAKKGEYSDWILSKVFDIRYQHRTCLSEVSTALVSRWSLLITLFISLIIRVGNAKLRRELPTSPLIKYPKSSIKKPNSRFWLPDIRDRNHANRAGSYSGGRCGYPRLSLKNIVYLFYVRSTKYENLSKMACSV